MRSFVLPKRYFLILFLIILAILAMLILVEFLTTSQLAPDLKIIIESPFTNALAENIFETLVIVIVILVLYTIGVYLIVRKMPDEVSRFTAVRIFTTILLALGFFLGMVGWIENAGQIALIIGIIWGPSWSPSGTSSRTSSGAFSC